MRSGKMEKENNGIMECRLGATSKQRLQTLDSVHFYACLPRNVRRLVFNRKKKSIAEQAYHEIVFSDRSTSQ